MTTTETNFLESSYRAASLYSRTMRNWIPSSGSADLDLLSDLPMLRARCRDAYRNYPLAHAAINRLVQHAIGSGLTPQFYIDGEALGYEETFVAGLERRLENSFNEWADGCDYDRDQDFGGLQSLALTSMLLSGDVFVNTTVSKNDAFLLQIIEADQVANPSFAPDTKKYRGGIELDDQFYPIAYWMLDGHPGDFFATWTWQRFPIDGELTQQRRIFQLKNKNRPGEHRGVPFLANVLESLRLLEKYTDAELQAAVISAGFTIFIKTPFNGPQTVENEQTRLKEVTIRPGMIVTLLPQEEIVTANPSRPNTAYPQFVQSNMQQIGAGIDLPIEFILQAYQSSYSAARAAMLQAWKTILIYRNLIIKKMCNPILKLWLRYEEIPESICKNLHVKWIGPACGSMDEYKEILAAKERVALGISSLAEECESLRGGDWLDVNKQRAIEVRMQKKNGIVAWQENQQTNDEILLEEEQDEQPK